MNRDPRIGEAPGCPVSDEAFCAEVARVLLENGYIGVDSVLEAMLSTENDLGMVAGHPRLIVSHVVIALGVLGEPEPKWSNMNTSYEVGRSIRVIYDAMLGQP